MHISIYDRNDYVGGRTTTVNIYDDPSKPAELGGSIFVEVNHIMVNASKDLGLEIKALRESDGDSADAFGVYVNESHLLYITLLIIGVDGTARVSFFGLRITQAGMIMLKSS